MHHLAVHLSYMHSFSWCVMTDSCRQWQTVMNHERARNIFPFICKAWNNSALINILARGFANSLHSLLILSKPLRCTQSRGTKIRSRSHYIGIRRFMHEMTQTPLIILPIESFQVQLGMEIKMRSSILCACDRPHSELSLLIQNWNTAADGVRWSGNSGFPNYRAAPLSDPLRNESTHAQIQNAFIRTRGYGKMEPFFVRPAVNDLLCMCCGWVSCRLLCT